MNYLPIEAIEPIFPILEKCRDIKQMKEHHPEGDVLNHSLQVFYHSIKETDDLDLILAALLHDVGKSIESEGHEKHGINLLQNIASTKTLWLIEHHMRIWYLILGDMKRLSKVLYLTNHPWLPELILLARWDKMGRNPNKTMKYDKNNILSILENKARKHFTDEKKEHKT